MKFAILTLFPEMFSGPFDHSIIKRAREKNLVEIEFINIRNFAGDTYKTVDDHPYGGGVGMVLKVDVVDKALESTKKKTTDEKYLRILLDPRGKKYSQQIATELTTYETIVLLCGHYEGVDERIRSLVDETISVGDYVVTGGELPAMILVDSVTRLLPGVLSRKEATLYESFNQNLLEYPQYTRPPQYKDMNVPNILLSGNHKEIEKWRDEQRRIITKMHRPDLQ